jgi:hypothetical protein
MLGTLEELRRRGELELGRGVCAHERLEEESSCGKVGFSAFVVRSLSNTTRKRSIRFKKMPNGLRKVELK